MKSIILFSSIALASGLFFVNVYTSLIDATSWGSHIPDSIATARDYYKSVNPGNFFRIFSPLNQLLGLVVLVLFWKSSPAIRLYVAIAFVLYIAAEGLTFGYFYPRNAIMFKSAQITDIDLLRKTWSQWNSMNWVRSTMLLVGMIFSMLALHSFYSLRSK